MAEKKAKKKTKKTKSKSSSSPNTIEAEWKKLMAANKDTPAKTYKMNTRFQLGEKMTHGSFGEGIVGKLIFPNKIEVIFQNEVKVLIHASQ